MQNISSTIKPPNEIKARLIFFSDFFNHPTVMNSKYIKNLDGGIGLKYFTHLSTVMISKNQR